jgi:hypothetical protein
LIQITSYTTFTGFARETREKTQEFCCFSFFRVFRGTFSYDRLTGNLDYFTFKSFRTGLFSEFHIQGINKTKKVMPVFNGRASPSRTK